MAARYSTNRDWEDTTILVNYVDKIVKKVEKYNLQYPEMIPLPSNQEAYKLEDDLTARFIREMRKAPFV